MNQWLARIGGSFASHAIAATRSISRQLLQPETSIVLLSVGASLLAMDANDNAGVSECLGCLEVFREQARSYKGVLMSHVVAICDACPRRGPFEKQPASPLVRARNKKINNWHSHCE
jgi:hypothetical protein